MGVYSQLTRDEIISWLRERQNHWMTPNYNRAAAMLESEAAENETLREWHLASQAEISRLQAELARLTKAHDAVSDRAMRSDMKLLTAWNDAIEAAADVFKWNECDFHSSDRKRIRAAIRALRKET